MNEYIIFPYKYIIFKCYCFFIRYFHFTPTLSFNTVNSFQFLYTSSVEMHFSFQILLPQKYQVSLIATRTRIYKFLLIANTCDVRPASVSPLAMTHNLLVGSHIICLLCFNCTCTDVIYEGELDAF